MKKEPIFEIIIDGEVTEEVEGWKKLGEVENVFIDIIRKQGYEQMHFSMSGSYGYHLFVNENNLKSRTFAWREFTGFVDKNGDRIYDGDMLNDGLSKCNFSLNEYSEYGSHTGYYMRSCDSFAEIPITGKEIKKDYTVVHRVFPDIVNKKIKKKK